MEQTGVSRRSRQNIQICTILQLITIYKSYLSLNLVLCLTKLVCLNIVFQSITRELNLNVILSLIISLSFGSVSFSFCLMLTSLRKKVESAKNRGLKSLEIVHILTTEEHIVCLILYACRFYVSSCQLIYNNVFTVLLKSLMSAESATRTFLTNTML